MNCTAADEKIVWGRFDKQSRNAAPVESDVMGHACAGDGMTCASASTVSLVIRMALVARSIAGHRNADAWRRIRALEPILAQQARPVLVATLAEMRAQLEISAGLTDTASLRLRTEVMPGYQTMPRLIQRRVERTRAELGASSAGVATTG